MCVLRVTGFNSYLVDAVIYLVDAVIYLVDAVTYLLDAVTLTFILEALLWMA
jgi:hypothetical protein